MELTDDGKPAKEVIESKGVPYFQMSNSLELLPKAYQKLKPGEEIAKRVEEYYQKYGVKELKLVR